MKLKLSFREPNNTPLTFTSLHLFVNLTFGVPDRFYDATLPENSEFWFQAYLVESSQYRCQCGDDG